MNTNQGFKTQSWPDAIPGGTPKKNVMVSSTMRFERIGQRIEPLRSWIKIGEAVLCNTCNQVVKDNRCKCNALAIASTESESVKIGNTLFVDGSPHVECGCCKQPIKLHEGQVSIRGVRDGKVKEFKDYSVPMLIGWMELTPEIIYEDGFPTLKRNIRPALKTVKACFECWNKWKQSGKGWI